MNYSERYNTLNECFRVGENCKIDKSGIEIKFFNFDSCVNEDQEKISHMFTDININENFSFKYPVFMPSQNQQYDKAILLLHGLNERSWSKYLTWAEYLCSNSGKPVIMFPIAYHMNRGPIEWSNPRKMTENLSSRKERYCGDRSISYANIALSERLSEHPSRFYLSGRQTLLDLTRLFEEIKNGQHPLFKEGTDINIFAYSIGAFLSQVALMANNKDLFSSSRLFMFCGGSIFSSMFGVSRSILDKASFELLLDYYINIFGNESSSIWKRDHIFSSFRKMITPDKYRDERVSIFDNLKERINGISLTKDIVIPYHGVKEAMGSNVTESAIKLKDFSFNYTHENPFPNNEKDITSVDLAFDNVFSSAVSFLA